MDFYEEVYLEFIEIFKKHVFRKGNELMRFSISL